MWWVLYHTQFQIWAGCLLGSIKAYEQVGVPLVQETRKHCCVGPHKTRVGELGVTSIAATDATWNSMIGANH